jgi:hypothetical protein
VVTHIESLKEPWNQGKVAPSAQIHEIEKRKKKPTEGQETLSGHIQNEGHPKESV